MYRVEERKEGLIMVLVAETVLLLLGAGGCIACLRVGKVGGSVSIDDLFALLFHALGCMTRFCYFL